MSTFDVKVAGFIHHDRQFKVAMPPEPRRLIARQVADPVLWNAPDICTEAAMERGWPKVAAKPTTQDERLTTLCIMDERRIDTPSGMADGGWRMADEVYIRPDVKQDALSPCRIAGSHRELIRLLSSLRAVERREFDFSRDETRSEGTKGLQSMGTIHKSVGASLASLLLGALLTVLLVVPTRMAL